MKAIIRHTYGSPDVLELKEIDKPAVGDDGVLVRVRAASLNAADLDYLYGRPALTRFFVGFRTPRTRGLGLDAAGQVEAVGPGVTRFQPGDHVFGDMTQFGYGAFAEYVSAPERAWAKIPEGMSFEIAATLPQSAILALQGLRGRRQLGPGDRVLINGASGNVGPFAVQIAKSFGAHVTGVCSTGKMDMVRGLGADDVIDYTREDYTKGGPRYDWILDVVGNHSILACRRSLKPGGVYLMAGGPTTRLLAALTVGPLISLVGSRKSGLMLGWKPFNKEDVAFLIELIETRRMTPVIDRRYPLDEVVDALRYLDEGRAVGKVIITV